MPHQTKNIRLASSHCLFVVIDLTFHKHSCSDMLDKCICSLNQETLTCKWSRTMTFINHTCINMYGNMSFAIEYRPSCWTMRISNDAIISIVISSVMHLNELWKCANILPKNKQYEAMGRLLDIYVYIWFRNYQCIRSYHPHGTSTISSDVKSLYLFIGNSSAVVTTSDATCNSLEGFVEIFFKVGNIL